MTVHAVETRQRGVRDHGASPQLGRRLDRRIGHAVGDLHQGRELRPSGEDGRARVRGRRDPEASDPPVAHRVAQEREQLLGEVRGAALVEEQEVHPVGPKLAQARLQAGSRLQWAEATRLDRARRPPPDDATQRRRRGHRGAGGDLRHLQEAGSTRGPESELGGHGHLVPPSGQEIPERALRLPVAVGASDVEVGDPGVEGRLEQADRLGTAGPRHQLGASVADAGASENPFVVSGVHHDRRPGSLRARDRARG